MKYRFERDPEGGIILVNVQLEGATFSIDMINNTIETIVFPEE